MITMRERLARAFIAEVERQCYNQAPEPDEPLTSDTGRDFGGFVIDGSLNGWAVLDAILAELSTPTPEMIEAGMELAGFDLASEFAAMISSVRRN